MGDTDFIHCTEVKNFCRDSIAALTALHALVRFDRPHVERSYGSLYEWRMTNACRASASAEEYGRHEAQVLSAHANDSCINYFYKYAVQSSRVEHMVHVIDSFLVPIMIGDPERVYDARRIGVMRGESGSCFSAASSAQIVLVPIHNETAFHWSLMAFFRIEKGLAAWYAVHYDTLSGYNRERAQLFFEHIKTIVPRDLDASVDFYEEMIEAVNVYQQPDGWSCGYRSASLAKLICSIAAAIEIENRGDDNSDSNRSVSIRAAKYMKENSGGANELDDEGCARFLADAIDAARSFELVQCVRERVANI